MSQDYNYITLAIKPIQTDISHEICIFSQLPTSLYGIFRIRHPKYQYTSTHVNFEMSNTLLSDHNIETNESIQNYQPITR